MSSKQGFEKRGQTPNNKDFAIRVSNLSKVYNIYERPEDRLKQSIFPRILKWTGRSSRKYYREFWALKDVNLMLGKGETLGIIGRNGAGKSTLLQIICGTLVPTIGEVEISGRVAALLELGSGFNPEFTGHENIYMNAAILGLTKEEIDARYDDIIQFADIGNFVYQPVKTYSSGMVVRLAFAIQTQVDPEILIVDEALSVGDAKFQVKCFNRLEQLRNRGTSILLVSHSHEQIVTHCSIAMILDQGNQLMIGDPKDVVNRYLDLVFGENKNTDQANEIINTSITNSDDLRTENAYCLSFDIDEFHKRNSYNKHEYRWGDRAATILDYHLTADDKTYPLTINTGQKIKLALAIKFQNSLYKPIVGLTIKTKEGVTVYGTNSLRLEHDEFTELGVGGSVIQVEISFDCLLAPGDYFISLGVATMHGEEVVPHDRRYDAIHVKITPNFSHFGLINLDLTMSAKIVRN